MHIKEYSYIHASTAGIRLDFIISYLYLYFIYFYAKKIYRSKAV